MQGSKVDIGHIPVFIITLAANYRDLLMTRFIFSFFITSTQKLEQSTKLSGPYKKHLKYSKIPALWSCALWSCLCVNIGAPQALQEPCEKHPRHSCLCDKATSMTLTVSASSTPLFL